MNEERRSDMAHAGHEYAKSMTEHAAAGARSLGYGAIGMAVQAWLASLDAARQSMDGLVQAALASHTGMKASRHAAQLGAGPDVMTMAWPSPVRQPVLLTGALTPLLGAARERKANEQAVAALPVGAPPQAQAERLSTGGYHASRAGNVPIACRACRCRNERCRTCNGAGVAGGIVCRGIRSRDRPTGGCTGRCGMSERRVAAGAAGARKCRRSCQCGTRP